ncbi:ECF transporter S component [Crassaminicella thermophila]|uniref:ECF transporter S component n=1 Tax=Crassaminicella thermophila TaxID=2599308 RepID=A0A5C0SEI6_CRATE|nr:ECF transporter S component [Crassaminicella thermophila]QEK11389.1 ECF transporter S component [Crassaminicella thermophila]
MNKLSILTIGIIGLVLLISIIPDSPLFEANWALISTIIIMITLVGFFYNIEKSKVTSKEITLISTLGALAAIVRMPFAYLMSIQPTTFIAMITGYIFGPQAGFMVGATAILVSNFYAGQGMWTPWQMFCMGIAGASAAILAKEGRQFNIKQFAFCCALWGYIYGWIMNLWYWTCFVYPLNFKTFVSTYLASLAFDTFRALGNMFFTLLLGNSFYRILIRFRKKLSIEYMKS